MSDAAPRSDPAQRSQRSRPAAAPSPAPGPARAARIGMVAVLAGVVALGLGSCSEKITSVDPSFTVPEGAASTQAGLAAWREIPNVLYIFRTGDPDSDPPVANVLLDSLAIITEPPGQLHGVIYDSTAASAYQVYRHEPNGGVLELFDFAFEPARRWFDRGWEIYHFTDPDTAVPTRAYLGRGVVAGTATASSPLTYEASVQVRSVPNITYTGGTGSDSQGGPAPLDSLFTMQWVSVPNAAAYFIHVYQPSFNLIQLPEQVASGKPAPLFVGKSRDILVAYLPVQPAPPPGTRISFTMPTVNARPVNARVMTVRQTRFGQEYLVRIAAVDASNQLIAMTRGHFSQNIGTLPNGFQLPPGQHASYYLGAVRVVPTRPRTPEPLRQGPARP